MRYMIFDRWGNPLGDLPYAIKAIRTRATDGTDTLDITTIGEMVEDEKAAALLWECGIKFGQGYLFGKPTVDAETLINCAKPTPFYNGMMRAKRIPKGKRQWWARSE